MAAADAAFDGGIVDIQSLLVICDVDMLRQAFAVEADGQPKKREPTVLAQSLTTKICLERIRLFERRCESVEWMKQASSDNSKQAASKRA